MTMYFKYKLTTYNMKNKITQSFNVSFRYYYVFSKIDYNVKS